jgi:pyroglutamyl-peptidase
MTVRPRILVTGFKPFPGAPYNPTEKLVARLMQLRRPALADVERIPHIFPVTYRDVDRQLPELIATYAPDALLMFGLATRTRHVRIESRARNTITQIWPDADHAAVRHRSIDGTSAATMPFGSHTRMILQSALTTGIDARMSISAGFYLCNYLSWRAIEATRAENGPRLAAFVHIPLIPRHPAATPQGAYNRVTFEQLADAGEAMLITMVKLAKQRRLNAQI